MDPIELVTTGVAGGGAAIARDADGRVVFVDGALGGERVLVEITESKRSFGRGRLVAVVEPSAGRITPVCPEVDRGCGGCDLAHASAAEQQRAKAGMVADALRRIGRLDPPPAVVQGPALATAGFRTTVRAGVLAGVDGGRAALRRRHSHDLVAVGSCRVAHPLVEDLLVHGRFGDATEVTIRVGARTGERMVVVDGDPATVRVPDDVTIAAPDSSEHAVHEEVDGRRFRISPRSFFQTRADGADALVAVVREAIGLGAGSPRADRSGATFVDLCSGVGLFAATVGHEFGRTVAVESNRSATADAAVNLAHLGARASIERVAFERWRPTAADVVVADPSRAGLGRAGVERVVATGADRVVLVSCDIGSLGRDAGLLTAAGWDLDTVTLVDLFPDTSHAEVVTSYRRTR